MNASYAGICGINEEELHHYFDEQTAQLAVALKGGQGNLLPVAAAEL